MASPNIQRLAMIQPSLIDDIISILRDYPDNSQILKEMIQNAEDAGARIVKFVFSKHQAGSSNDRTYHKYLKGPALCVYNDAMFTDKDWKGIRTLRKSDKEDEPLKVGKFGLGFKSIFHLTDSVCVISGDRVMFIDPHNDDSSVCMKLNFFNSLIDSNLSDMFTDLGINITTLGNSFFQGTVFWCPLRDSPSRISEKRYTEAEVMDLFNSFQIEAHMELLFLKYLEKIELFTSGSTSAFGMGYELIFFVEIDSEVVKNIRHERTAFIKRISEMERQLSKENPVNISQMTPISMTNIMTINTHNYRSTEQYPSKNIWVVVQYFHAGKMSRNMAELIANKHHKYRPYAGLAVPLCTDLKHAGHIFCFLPLPLGSKSHTGLPVHVNGYFELSSNRRDLKWPTYDQEASNSHKNVDILWNQALINEVIPIVYQNLLNSIASICISNGNTGSLISLFLRAIPNEGTVDNKWLPIVRPIIQYLYKNPLLCASNQSWINGNEAIFAVYENLDRASSATVSKLFKLSSQNLVEIEPHLLDSIRRHATANFRTTSPMLLKKLLKTDEHYKQLDRQEKLQVLRYACSDGQYNDLCGLELIPMADGTFKTFKTDNFTTPVYICHKVTENLFPGMESLLVFPGQGTEEVLNQIAYTGKYQLQCLDQTTAIHMLEKVIFEKTDRRDTYFSLNADDPNMGEIWLKRVWMYLYDTFRYSLVNVKHLPILPFVDDTEDENKIIQLCRIDELLMPACNTFSSYLLDALKLLGVRFVLDFKIFCNHPQMNIGGKFIEYPNFDGLINVIAKLEKKPEKEQIIYKFNNICSHTSREELRAILSQSINMHNSKAIAVISKLEIFKEKSCSSDKMSTWQSIDNNPDMLEMSFCCFPIRFPFPLLIVDSVFDQQLVLCLGGNEKSRSDVVSTVIKIILDSNIYNLCETRMFMKFLITYCRTWPDWSFLKNEAAKIKFLKDKKGKLRRADEFFDPGEENLKELFWGEDKFPSNTDAEESFLNLLRKIGLKKAVQVNPIDIVTTCSVLEEMQRMNVGSKQLFEKSDALLMYLLKHSDILNTIVGKTTLAKYISSKRCFRYVKQKPDTYPESLPWYQSNTSLCEPRHMRPLCERNLIGSVLPTYSIDIPDQLLELFSETKTVPLSLVTKQLNLVIQHCTVDWSSYAIVQQMCMEIYSFLDHNLQLQKTQTMIQIQEAFSGRNVILTSQGFVHPANVAIELNVDCAPDLFGLNLNPILQYRSFLTAVGVRDRFSPRDVIDALKEKTKRYGKRSIPEEELTLVRNLALLFEDMREIPNDQLRIFLPDSNRILRDVTELYLDDCAFISDSKTMWPLHPSIPNSVAYKLKIKTKREQDLDENLDGSEFGQHQELLDRINRILDGYPCDSGIMKELLQNADDARATKLHFFLDNRHHNKERVFCDSWGSIQGPALCVYNNSVFTGEDIKGIQKLGCGSKVDDLTQTGQYGVGFNSVYHITDVPSFLSKDPSDRDKEVLCILDPHCLYAPNATEQKPGRMFKNLDAKRRSYTDVFPCYLEEFWPDKKGTLFRLPLRSPEMASKSKISPDIPMTKNKIKKLLQEWMENMKESVLFLHNIKTVSVSEIDAQGKMHELYTVEKSSTKKDAEKCLNFFEAIKAVKEKKSNPFEVDCIDVNYIQSIKVNSENIEQWLIVQKLGFSKDDDVPSLLLDACRQKKLQLLPRGGIAHLISNTEGSKCSTHITAKRFKAYCSLPLPKDTGLPVHINGHFALDHEARRNIWWPDVDRDWKKTWNRYLLEDVVASAYVIAIHCWKDRLFPQDTEAKTSIRCLSIFNQIFPNFKCLHDDIWKWLVTAVYKQIYDQKHKLFAVVLQQNAKRSVQCSTSKQSFGEQNRGSIMISQWVPVCIGEGGLFPAYFDDLKIQFQKDIKYDYYNVSTYFIEEEIIDQTACDLRDVLKDLGMKIISCPLWIYKSMKDSGLTVETVSRQSVMSFLKSFSRKRHLDRCKLESVNVLIEETKFRTISRVGEVINYCNFHPEEERLQGLPLLVTADGKLRTFSTESPVYMSSFANLLPISSHTFLHTFFIEYFGDNFTNSFPKYFKLLDIEDFAMLLPRTLPKSIYMTGDVIVQWDKENDNQILNKGWMSLFWKFMWEKSQQICKSDVKILEEEESRKNVEQPELDSATFLKDGKHNTTNQSQGQVTILTEKTRSKQKKENEIRLQNFIDIVVSLLGDWNLYPVFQTTYRSQKLIHYLIPLKHAKSVLHQPYCGNKELYTAIRKLELPQPDIFSMNDLSGSQKRVAIKFITDVNNCTDLILCLKKHFDTLVATELSEEDCNAILGHIYRNFEDIKQSMNQRDLVEYLRSLPLYITCDGSRKNLTDCNTVISLPAKIPSQGIGRWAIKSNITLLYQNDSLTKLYSFIGCIVKAEWDVYSSYIFKYFYHLPDNAILSHFVYLRDKVIPPLKSKPEFELFKESLQNVRFIIDEKGNRKMACEFYSPHIDVFRLMCTEFPPADFSDGKWKEFMIYAGVKNDVTNDDFIKFARLVELLGTTKGITDTIREKSCILLKHLQNKSMLYSEIRFLQDVSTIRFIVPFTVPYNYSVLHAQNNGGEQLVCFRNSVGREQWKLVWTKSDIITDLANPNKWYSYSQDQRRNIKSYLGFQDKPCSKSVVAHARDFCKTMSKKRIKSQIENDFNLHTETMDIMNNLYDFFDEHRNSDTVKQGLSSLPIIYIAEKRIFVPSEKVVLNMNEQDTIPPYLYKASLYYGRYYELFQYLGVSKELTSNHYVGVLGEIQSLVKDGIMEPNEQKAVKKAVQKLFENLQRHNDQEQITYGVIYLPSKSMYLTASSHLVFMDLAHLMKRVKSNIKDFECFVGFKELGIVSTDSIEYIKLLPEKYRPKMLSAILQETITDDSKDSVVHDDNGERLQRFLRSQEFCNGIKRLVNHNLQKYGDQLQEEHSTLIQSLLETVQVFTVEILTSCIRYEGFPVKDSEEIRLTMKEIKHQNSQRIINIYIKKMREDSLQLWIDKIAQDISIIINACIGDVLGSSCTYVSNILRCINMPSRIELVLDSKYIRPLEIGNRIQRAFEPDLGSYVPVDLHHILDTSITTFDNGDYVAYEVYDPDLESEDVITKKDCPVYIIAQILERLENGPEQGLGFHSISLVANLKYRVDIGNQDIQEVVSTQIFKFKRQPESEEIEIVSEKTIIMEHMQNASSQLLENKNRIIKRLILHYHPNNHDDNKEIYNILFNFLLCLIQKVEAGESINKTDVCDTKTLRPKTSNSVFIDNVIDRSRALGTSRQSYQQTQGETIYQRMRKSGPQPGQTKRWLLQANYDLEAARNDMCTNNTFNWACFKCHQAAEKALKAMQYYIDADSVDRTHLIYTLASTTGDKELMDLSSKLERVTGNYFQMRYPDAIPNVDGMGGQTRLPSTIYSAKDATTAFKYTKEIVLVVQRKTSIMI